MKNSEPLGHLEALALKHTVDDTVNDEYSEIPHENIPHRNNDVHKKIEHAFNLYQQASQKALSDTPQMMLSEHYDSYIKNEPLVNMYNQENKKASMGMPQTTTPEKNTKDTHSLEHPTGNSESFDFKNTMGTDANNQHSRASSDNPLVKNNDAHSKNEAKLNINNLLDKKSLPDTIQITPNTHSPLDKKSLSDAPQAAILKNIIDVSFDDFIHFVIEKNIDVMTNPLARNVLSLIHLVNIGFSKDNQKFNLEKIKSFLKYLNDKSFTKKNNKDGDDSAKESINDIFGTMLETIIVTMSSEDAEIDTNISNSAMSFSSDSSEHTHRWYGLLEIDDTKGIVTHNFSTRFLEFIKREGKKNYYNDIYSKFHKDDIIKMAYILEDSFLYDFLLQSGQITYDELATLPIIGKHKPTVNAHYDALMSPEIMIEFLLQQKLLNPKSQEHLLETLDGKPWFNSGGLQTLIQVIGGEIITPQEIHFFIEWHLKNPETFDALFDFFDIQKDYSLIRLNEQSNMRSKHLSADSIKAAYMTQTFITLKSASDPLLPEFFDLDFSKTVEAGFYSGLSYKDYFLLRGFDISKIEDKTKFSQISAMTHKQTGHNLLIV